MVYAPDQLLTSLLKEVSRSFYLTLRILPGKVRPQIGLAYLLARTTDTIADTQLIPLEQRLQAMQTLRDHLSGRRSGSLDLGELVSRQGSAAERTLLENCASIFALLDNLSAADRHLVVEVLITITSGQELDLRRFNGASVEHIFALRTDEELDDYTFRVAGCVGEFWTRICRSNLFPHALVNESLLIENGVRFGKGLQLVNILRDIPGDLRQGRCYLPEEKLIALGLPPKDLLLPANESRLRLLYNFYLDKAEAHLKAGWTYTTSLPRGCARLRLACAWPVLIGLETIQLLRVGNVLDARQKIKVPRRKLRQLILRSVLLYPWSRAWDQLALADRPLPSSSSS